jgi:hypothetical protein
MYNFISAHKYEHVICIEIQRKRNHWTETQRTEEKEEEEEKAKCFSIYLQWISSRRRICWFWG